MCRYCAFSTKNQTPRSDSANLEPSEPIFYPQILEPRFLCAAGSHWKFCYAYSYNVQSYAPGDPASPNHTLAGQPLQPSWVPDDWYPLLKKAPGTPLHECVYDSATQTFRREWTGVSVSLSMRDETSVITWK